VFHCVIAGLLALCARVLGTVQAAHVTRNPFIIKSLRARPAIPKKDLQIFRNFLSSSRQFFTNIRKNKNTLLKNPKNVIKRLFYFFKFIILRNL